MGASGDTVTASAIVPAVRSRWACAHISWVAGRRLPALVRQFDGVDAVIEVNEDRLFAGDAVARARELLKTGRQVARRNRRAIIAYADWRYAALAWCSGTAFVSRAPLDRLHARSRWHGDTYVLLAARTAVAPFGPTPPYRFIPPGAEATIGSSASTPESVADVEITQVMLAVHSYLSPSGSPLS